MSGQGSPLYVDDGFWKLVFVQSYLFILGLAGVGHIDLFYYSSRSTDTYPSQVLMLYPDWVWA